MSDNAPESDRTDLLSELEVMKKLMPHPHVIKMMGCVTESGKGNALNILFVYMYAFTSIFKNIILNGSFISF